MYVFIPGCSYYVLTEDEYNLISELLLDEESKQFNIVENDLLSDFSQAEDGNYYAIASGGDVTVQANESGFLEYWGLGNVLNYKKSTQSTSFFA